jgi:hypothetical protein
MLDRFFLLLHPVVATATDLRHGCAARCAPSPCRSPRWLCRPAARSVLFLSRPSSAACDFVRRFSRLYVCATADRFAWCWPDCGALLPIWLVLVAWSIPSASTSSVRHLRASLDPAASKSRATVALQSSAASATHQLSNHPPAFAGRCRPSTYKPSSRSPSRSRPPSRSTARPRQPAARLNSSLPPWFTDPAAFGHAGLPLLGLAV